MEEFKIGDRVRCIKKMDYADVGEIGTIKEVDNCSFESYELTIHWDNDVDGWGDELLSIPLGYGEYLHKDNVEKIEGEE